MSNHNPWYVDYYHALQDEAAELVKRADLIANSTAPDTELLEIWGELRATRNSAGLHLRLVYEAWLERKWSGESNTALLFKGTPVGKEVALMVASRIG